MKKLFVNKLSYRITDEDLQQAFEEYGKVISARVIKDNFTGKSRGFGFVEMEQDADAEKAIAELDQAEFDGRVIAVSEARPKTANRPGSFRNDSSGPGQGQKRRW
jgi:RNA recognition motif-containing protein